MSKLTKATELGRIAQVLSVMRLVSEGDTKVVDACAEVGIPVSTYYDWVRRGDDTIDAFRKLVLESQRVMLHDVVIHKLQVLEKVIQDALGKDIEPKDRQGALSLLLMIEKELSGELKAVSGYEEDAAVFLKDGPTLTPMDSRVGNLRIDIDDDGGVVVETEKRVTIIDPREVEEAETSSE